MTVIARADRGFFGFAIVAMVAVVVASNILVQYPFEPFGLADWLTWGAFTYPLAFFVTDLTNRQIGAGAARRVVYAGFLVAVLLSALLSEPRIAAASGLAFLVGQLLDVTIFNSLRRQVWWRAPLVSSALASIVDTVIFFTAAFAFSGLPWIGWAAGDLAVKFIFTVGLLAPFRLFIAFTRRPQAA
ncbi:queuosine precursor transporter [Zavarzinia compransoris]|uniref:queuosine precursor transporter n=1 Tax=Zavarzinia marina TaxID=2911065 RepID=UPI001F211CCE|nr:queuosine precursor transporter [Zavarzinia marina]MCF4164233.1 queuosine precursor transporter [Zavarzinia marina]